MGKLTAPSRDSISVSRSMTSNPNPNARLPSLDIPSPVSMSHAISPGLSAGTWMRWRSSSLQMTTLSEENQQDQEARLSLSKHGSAEAPPPLKWRLHPLLSGPHGALCEEESHA